MTIREARPAGFGADSHDCFEQVLAWLEGVEAAVMSHGELEDELESRGRELLRHMLQDHLTLRAANEPRLAAVTDDAGVVHAAVETGHGRTLTSVFGQVQVERLAYRHRGHANLHPADAALNLPAERHSHGLRRLAAIESTRGSFEQAGAAITRGTGQQVGKRQVEDLTARAAVDVEDFYATAERTESAPDDTLVLTADAKGIVMRPDSLRPATAKAAAKASTKLAAVRSVLRAGAGYIEARDTPTQPPLQDGQGTVSATRLGWQAAGDGALRPAGTRIGWLAGKHGEMYVLLDPANAFKVAQRHQPDLIPYGSKPTTSWNGA